MKKIITLLLIVSLGIFSTISSASTQTNYSIEGDNNIVIQNFSGSEYINNYDVDIKVDKNGVLDVTETISVYAANRQINHGIYRDFPLYYTLPFGFKSSKYFEIVEIKRGGRPEPYKDEYIQNGVRIYIGDGDITLNPGLYTYTIHYKTGRQMGFFDDHDELYYNLIGTEWAFPIRKATATITFPETVSLADDKVTVFTGAAGAKDSAATVSVNKNIVIVRANNALEANEGMTGIFEFPQGTFPKETETEKTLVFIQDNILILFAAATTGALAIFYFVFWYLFGRDRGSTLEVVQYSPIEGVSSGGSRFLTRMNFDMKALTAALTELAVLGKLRIEESTKNESSFGLFQQTFFSVIKTNDTDVSKLPVDLQSLYEELFRRSDSVDFVQTNHSRVQFIISHYRSKLEEIYGRGKYFTRNTFLIVMGILISVLVALFLFIHAARFSGEDGIGLFIFGALWTGALMIMIRQYLVNKNLDLGRLLMGVVVFILTGTIGLFVLILSYDAVSLLGIVSILVTMFISVVFIPVMPARNKEGRDLQNNIDGFRKYLTLAEEERIKFFNKELPHDIQTYEKLLPYAIAFDIETKWTKEFADTIAKAEQDGYQPTWYVGHHLYFSSANFGSSFSQSLSSTLTSSSVDPSSSSGSSGGGFSGGGGGGGGGGGW